jgi:DNA-directed RNA polymerase subunit H (RpoH/RPB5)
MDTTEELFDLVARTRPVILDILNKQGYETSPYDNQSPADITKLATCGPNHLRMRLYAKDDNTFKKRAQVFYWIFEKVRLSLERRVQELWDTDQFEDNAANEETDEAIVIINEPMHEAFHLMAIKQWQLNKRRIVFYYIKQIISNPANHVLQPKFRKIPASEEPELLANLRLKHKKNIPLIKYHVDIMTRVMGLAPDNIVEITRPSPTTGDYVMYRICSI